MSLASRRSTYYSHQVCSSSGKIYAKNALSTHSNRHDPLLPSYQITHGFHPSDLSNRPQTMWRYKELLPLEKIQNCVSLGEGMTPMVSLQKLEKLTPGLRIHLKDESMNPTGSYKARALSMAVSKAKEIGAEKCAISTASSAGSALAAYCAKADIEAHIYLPEQTSKAFIQQCHWYGAKVTLVKGSIRDCTHRLQAVMQEDWFDVSSTREPFRLEGTKTIGFEIAEQLEWEVPEVIILPTGKGLEVISLWKALEELQQIGWIARKRPKLVAVQSTTFDPLVRAYQDQQQQLSLKIPMTSKKGEGAIHPFGQQHVLQLLERSGGTSIAISDQEIRQGLQELGSQEGILVAPEGASAWAACKQLYQKGWLKGNERVVLINPGTVYQSMEN